MVFSIDTPATAETVAAAPRGGLRRRPLRGARVSGRGGGWVVAQFALMSWAALVAIVVPPDWPSGARDVLAVVGAVLLLAGAVVAVAAGRSLGRAMTPFPRRSRGPPLVETGPYRVVRHPVYTGGPARSSSAGR